VLLMTARTGAVGLTLTEAQYVFFMDPFLNTQMENQAKNRVYRLGQTKDVYIKRLVMKDSVEESILEMNQAQAGDRTALSSSSSSMRENLRAAEIRVLESCALSGLSLI
jgi:SNF2 family DNA or RNA helicase